MWDLEELVEPVGFAEKAMCLLARCLFVGACVDLESSLEDKK